MNIDRLFCSKENGAGTPDNSPALTVHWNSVVPEFPPALVLPIFIVTILLAVIIHRKKKTETSVKI